jgi:uncharacterized protein (TIGR02453 family)
MTYFKQGFLDFYKELAANNNKDWFDANRKRYEEFVKKPFVAFVQAFIDEVAKEIPTYKELTASECIFRINRDIRFSKDKTPYKLFSSAVIAPNGKKSHSIHGIYFELNPEAIRIYGGIYEIDKESLLQLREGIAVNTKAFRSIIEAPVFKDHFGEIRGDKNKILPAELKSAAEKEPLLFNKQFYVMTELPAELITSDKLLETLRYSFETIKPLEQFFNQYIQRN